jgi:LemA protein
MNLELMAALLVAAVLFFWATGAHNRLVLLRNQVVHAGVRLTEALALRTVAQTQLLAALQPSLAAEAGALQALISAQAAEQAAARALAARPLDSGAARDWLAAQAPLDAATARVLALLDQQLELKQQDAVAQPLAQLQSAQARLLLLRPAYNDAAGEYDRAIALFPTRLLVPLFRFQAAGRV